ncbi:hypothetical protein RJ55_05952 [Drechmeria coniospora]|nr:hypothetical protein RJ55_05952 [Drechmeria coniospora]
MGLTPSPPSPAVDESASPPRNEMAPRSQQPLAASATSVASTTSATSSTASYSPATRRLHQLGLFFAGASFLAASIAVARRSVIRRKIEALPAFHTSNRLAFKPGHGDDGADRVLLASHALGLATLNVMSFGVMLTGGIAWGWDLCSVAELRERTQAALQRPGNEDPEAEREMEEMMKSLLEKLGMDATLPEKPGKPAEDQASGAAHEET